jgi:hypothetical protein
MKRRYTPFIVIFTTLMLTIGILVVEVAKANPINTRPGYNIITIQSPQDNRYNINPISLNFTVRSNLFLYFSQFFYTIDGDIPQNVSQRKIIDQKMINDTVNPSPYLDYGPYYFPYTEYILEGNTALPYLAEGWHNLTVSEYSSGVLQYIAQGWKNLTVYEHGSATVSFYVTANSALLNYTPKPTPTMSFAPSISPTPITSQSTSSDYWLNPTFITGISGVIAIVAVASVSLLYFRRKGKP